MAIALGLARSDSLDVEQFFLVDRIDGCHLFQGNVLEDDVRRALQFAGHIVAQVLEHGEELRVEHAETAFASLLIVLVLKLCVHDHLEGLRAF